MHRVCAEKRHNKLRVVQIAQSSQSHGHENYGNTRINTRQTFWKKSHADKVVRKRENVAEA